MTTKSRSYWERLLGKTHSPIEAIFLDSFCPLAIEHGYEVQRKIRSREGIIGISVQAPIGPYFADFLISYPFFGRSLCIAVECDGHDYHERTRRQAAYDRSRDRYMQGTGLEVYRFTGSEIVAAPHICAWEVLDAIMRFQTAEIIAAAGRPE